MMYCYYTSFVLKLPPACPVLVYHYKVVQNRRDFGREVCFEEEVVQNRRGFGREVCFEEEVVQNRRDFGREVCFEEEVALVNKNWTPKH